MNHIEAVPGFKKILAKVTVTNSSGNDAAAGVW